MRAAAPPFRSALELEPRGGGRFAAALGRDWTVGPKAHGGLLLALLVRAGLARLSAEGPEPDPLAIAADFLRAPAAGPVELHTEILKRGRTVSVVAVRLLQDERAMLASTVTAGRLPTDVPQWADLPGVPAEPPADAIDPSNGTRVRPGGLLRPALRPRHRGVRPGGDGAAGAARLGAPARGGA